MKTIASLALVGRSSTLIGVIAVATAALAGAACSKKDGGQEQPAKTEAANIAPKDAAPVAKKPLTVEFFGKDVAPPAVLAPFKPGMPVAQAKQLSADHWLPQESIDVEGVKAMWADQKNMTEVGDTLIELPLDKMPLVAQAWGPGTEATRGNDPVTVWRNPLTGIRAELSISFDKKNGDLRFSPYYPTAKLLGDGPTLAFFDKPILGTKLDEVKANYPHLVDGEYLNMPLSDYGFSGTNTGELLFLEPRDGSGPITEYSFAIPYKSSPAFKDELLALFEKKWGKAKPGKPPFKTEMVYQEAGPRIFVEDQRGTLQLTVRSK